MIINYKHCIRAKNIIGGVETFWSDIEHKIGETFVASDGITWTVIEILY